MVVHALTGSPDAAGDWWAPPSVPDVRSTPGRQVGVLAANLLGGRYGSTGPRSPDPVTGLLGARFPMVTTRDQAGAQWRLLDALGIDRVALVTGGSLGGMVALELALLRPAAVEHVCRSPRRRPRGRSRSPGTTCR